MAIHSSMGYKWLITHSCTFPKDSSDPSLVSRSQSESCSVVSNSLWPHGLYSPWNSPGLNTGMGCLPLLQGIFPTRGWNPGLLLCKQILYQLSHRGNPRVLEWVACLGLFVIWGYYEWTWSEYSCRSPSKDVFLFGKWSCSVVSDSLQPHGL